MGSPNTARPHGSLWGRLVDAFLGRGTVASAITPNSLKWRVDPDTESWWYQPPVSPAGYQEIQAQAPDGYDFARLVWQACETCRLGLIVKIRVTGPWQRHGYASRMVCFALQGRDGYDWTTTPQSEDAREFFPALTESTGVAFPRQMHACEHMLARPRHAEPARRLDPPP